MEATILTATPEQAGQRLDAFLAQALPELTRSAAQRLIAEGQVTVDGKAPAKSMKLSGGETVAVTAAGAGGGPGPAGGHPPGRGV